LRAPGPLHLGVVKGGGGCPPPGPAPRRRRRRAHRLRRRGRCDGDADSGGSSFGSDADHDDGLGPGVLLPLLRGGAIDIANCTEPEGHRLSFRGTNQHVAMCWCHLCDLKVKIWNNGAVEIVPP